MKDRLHIGAAFLSAIVLSSPFFGISLWSMTMQTPQVYTQSSVLTFEILNATIRTDRTETVTLFPNGTKKVHIAYSTKEIPDCRILKFNSTKYFQPEDMKAGATMSEIAQRSTPSATLKINPTAVSDYAGSGLEPPGQILNPVYPPDVSPPPVPFLEKEKSGNHRILYLYPGTNYPNGSDPFQVNYMQPDNWFSYHPKDWWKPWAYIVETIHAHLNRTVIDDYVEGRLDAAEFLGYSLSYASMSLGLAGTVAAFLAVAMAGAFLATCVCPPLVVVFALLAIMVDSYRTDVAHSAYTEADWIKHFVQTDEGDGFCFLKIRQGTDDPLAFNPWDFTIRPWVLWRCTRNYDISWGKEREKNTWTRYNVFWECADYDLGCPWGFNLRLLDPTYSRPNAFTK